MLHYISIAGILLIIAFGATLTGRALLGSIRSTLFNRPTAENWILAAALGSGVWILVVGTASHAGMTAPAAGVVLAGVIGALVTICFLRRRTVQRLGRPSGALAIAGLLAVGLFAAGLYLWPLLVYRSYSIFNDTFTYATISEWLQGHSFSTPHSSNQDFPASRPTEIYQNCHLRMGATFFLALLQAALPRYRSVELFPLAMAWFVALNALGVYLICRWTVRLPRSYAAAAGLLLVAGLGPFHWTTRDGFYPQLAGTAFLLTFVACLSRLSTVGNCRAASAVLLGCLGASLLSTYSEMAPVLAVLCAAYAGVSGIRAWRKNRMRRWAAFLGQCGAALLLFGHIEWPRATLGVIGQLAATPGGPISWPRAEFWAFAMGYKSYGAAAALTAAFLVGAGCLLRRRGVYPLVVVSVAFAALGSYFAFRALDPWSGKVGHTWSMLKVATWAFPVVVAFQVTGIWRLTRRMPRHEFLAGLGCLGIVAGGYSAHSAKAPELAAPLRAFLDSDEPFATMAEMNRRLQATGAKRVFLLEPTETVWPVIYLPYLFPETAFENGWSNGWLGRAGDSLRPTPRQPQTLLLLKGPLPFGQVPSAKVTELGAGWIACGAPASSFVFRVHNPNFGISADATHLWLGSVKAAFSIYTPNAGIHRFSFLAAPGPGLPETPRRTVEITVPGQPPLTVVASDDAWAPHALSLDLALAAGVTHLEIRCPDPPSQLQPQIVQDGVPGALLVGVSQARIVPLDGASSSGEPSQPRPNAAKRPLDSRKR